MIDSAFWYGRKVFLTGHTGFKGGWLSVWLANLGTEVTGYALPPPTDPAMFFVASVNSILKERPLIIQIGKKQLLSVIFQNVMTLKLKSSKNFSLGKVKEDKSIFSKSLENWAKRYISVQS